MKTSPASVGGGGVTATSPARISVSRIIAHVLHRVCHDDTLIITLFFNG
jgi:hypothetical protein